MFNYFLLTLLLHLASGEILFSNNTRIKEQENYHEIILCRRCGSEISYSNGIISKTSPLSYHSYYQNLFDVDNIHVQILLSDYFFYFPIITTTQSNCIGVGEWEEKDTWFPGYRWKPCICPDCGEYVGWIFEPIESDSVEQVDKFFGLILSSLVGQSFVNSLIVYPRESSNYEF